MARYHINAKGEPGVCRAQQSCPFGGAEDHYGSADEARQAFEASQADSTFTKTSVKSDEYYTIKQTWADSPTMVTMGRYSTPAEAFDALSKENRQEGATYEVVKRTYTVKTISTSSEEIVAQGAAFEAVDPAQGMVGRRVKLDQQMGKQDPALLSRVGQVVEISAVEGDTYTVRFVDGTEATVPASALTQQAPPLAPPSRRAEFDTRLVRAVASTQREYDALEDKQGWVEAKAAVAAQAQLELDETPRGTAGRGDAIVKRDEARMAMLAADIVQVQNSSFQDGGALEEMMIEAERKRGDADSSLESSLNNSTAQRVLARRLRIQPEDVASVFQLAQNEFKHPRRFRSGTVGDLANDRQWCDRVARTIRCQGEDVAAVLDFSTRFSQFKA